MQEQLPRVTMHGLEKSVRDPENTALKALASKNLCNARVYLDLEVYNVRVNPSTSAPGIL
jgi:hypothetical protein